MSDYEQFLMTKLLSILFRAKMVFQKQGLCVDFEIKKMEEISRQLELIRSKKDS